MSQAMKTFVPEHLEKFREFYKIRPENYLREDENPVQWFKQVSPDERVNLPEGKITCRWLLEKQSDPNFRTLDLCVGIFAWGGMQRGHGKSLFKNREDWLEVAEKIRLGDSSLNLIDAYDEFARLQKSKRIPGMGPAFFTKLIYFLASRLPQIQVGYIMDQWAGYSINLLTGKRIVRFEHSLTIMDSKESEKIDVENDIKVTSTVSNKNTGADYKRFCDSIDALRVNMGNGWDHTSIDCALVSSGGRRPEPWRKYVVNSRIKELLKNINSRQQAVREGTANQRS